MSATAHTVTWPIPDPHAIVLAGDWHGNTTAARDAITVAERLNAPVVLQLGDFGLWPGSSGQRYLTRLNSYAKKHQVLVAWIDGNHEDFTQLNETPVDSNGLQWQDTHIAHIPRGSHWTWHGHRFAGLGGATSLDRPDRTPGKTWWPQEAVTDRDLDTLEAGGHCDVLLTHDSPTGVHIPGIDQRNYSAALASGWTLPELERAWDHRDRIRQAIDTVRPLHLWHGHYHLRYTSTLTLNDGHTVTANGLSWDGDARDKRLSIGRITPDHLDFHTPQQALNDAVAHC